MAGSSAQARLQTCALCTTPARYKCPRCAAPTCSLLCARKHKEDTRCTGERDRVQYVPMNRYQWGTMMRDYCYLEDVGRKVSEWGSEIVRGGYMASKAASAPRSSSKKPTTGKSKRDVLRDHLETLGIDIELLPARMERRSLNQSTFDQKSKRSLLTIESIFYPPSTLASMSSPRPPSYKVLSHRNDLSATLLSVLQCQVSSALSKSQKQKENSLDWLLSMVSPHPDATGCFTPPHCYMRASTELPLVPNAIYYYRLEPTLSLRELLQKTSFIEFPTIHIYDPEASSFCGTVVDKFGTIIHVSEDDQVNVFRRAEQRKPSTNESLNAAFGLIGGYGSEGSSHSEEEPANEPQSGLVMLGMYSESDGEGDLTNPGAEEDPSDSDNDMPAEGDRLDPARLLELVKSAADEDIGLGDDGSIVEEQRSERPSLVCDA